jgi:hypothetical protein
MSIDDRLTNYLFNRDFGPGELSPAGAHLLCGIGVVLILLLECIKRSVRDSALKKDS